MYSIEPAILSIYYFITMNACSIPREEKGRKSSGFSMIELSIPHTQLELYIYIVAGIVFACAIEKLHHAADD